MMPASPPTIYPVITQNVRFYRVQAFDAYPYVKLAIFTRQGGASLAPFQGLNLGSSVGDDPETVKKNFAQVCRAINITPEQTVSCHLTHSARILTIKTPQEQHSPEQADALITTTQGVFLSMRFGDCTPLIFFDPVRRAVGLAHAGWRGTLQNIARQTVLAMEQQFGCQPKDMVAVIGPAIGPCCYEVGPDVIGAAAHAFGDSSGPFFRPNGRPDHAHFDMWAANCWQLSQAGVQQIISSGLCTACRTDEFFSHRAERGRTGRFGVIIGLQGMAG